MLAALQAKAQAHRFLVGSSTFCWDAYLNVARWSVGHERALRIAHKVDQLCHGRQSENTAHPRRKKPTNFRDASIELVDYLYCVLILLDVLGGQLYRGVDCDGFCEAARSAQMWGVVNFHLPRNAISVWQLRSTTNTLTHDITVGGNHEDLFSLLPLSALAFSEVDQQSLRRKND